MEQKNISRKTSTLTLSLNPTRYQMIWQQEENTSKNNKRKTANTDAHFSGTGKDIALIDLSSAVAPQRKRTCSTSGLNHRTTTPSLPPTSPSKMSHSAKNT